MLDRWKKAVVHLECVRDSIHYLERKARVDNLHEQFSRGEISAEEFARRRVLPIRDERYTGTALLISYRNKRFLLTARHVVHDSKSAMRDIEETIQRSEFFDSPCAEQDLNNANVNAESEIFRIIFRIPTLEERIADLLPDEFLMNLGSGVTWERPYSFSDPDTDLAVISLDQRHSRFADEMEKPRIRCSTI